jgi:hypothetical protein
MGDEMTGHRTLDRPLGALARLLALALEPGERSVVLGDLIESHASAGRAVRDVASLVARRQLALWAVPAPWIALLALALPVGVLLSHVSRMWSDGSVVYLKAYVEGFTWTYVTNPGSRLDMAQLATWFVLNAVALWVWSWTAGFALGRLSRRTLWLTGAVFAVAVFAGTLGTWTTARGPFGRGMADSHLYGVVLPRLFRVGLVLLPAWLGARGARRLGESTFTRAVSVALVAVVLTGWRAQGVEASLTFGRSQSWTGPGPDATWGTEDDPRPLALRLIPLALAWPAAFAVTLTIRRAHKNDGIMR